MYYHVLITYLYIRTIQNAFRSKKSKELLKELKNALNDEQRIERLKKAQGKLVRYCAMHGENLIKSEENINENENENNINDSFNNNFNNNNNNIRNVLIESSMTKYKNLIKKIEDSVPRFKKTTKWGKHRPRMLCRQCKASAADRKCIDCGNRLLCFPCYADTHKSKKREKAMMGSYIKYQLIYLFFIYFINIFLFF